MAKILKIAVIFILGMAFAQRPYFRVVERIPAFARHVSEIAVYDTKTRVIWVHEDHLYAIPHELGHWAIDVFVPQPLSSDLHRVYDRYDMLKPEGHK